jgi:putative transposase
MPYCDLRQGRHTAHGKAYHITTVTLGRAPYFLELAAGRVVMRQLRRLQDEGRADTLCFVVMPDHLHWLMVLRAGTLADAVRLLKGRSAHELGRPLWQPNYGERSPRVNRYRPPVLPNPRCRSLQRGLHLLSQLRFPLFDMTMGQRLVLGGMGLQLGTIQGNRPQPNHFHRLRQREHLDKQLFQFLELVLRKFARAS